MIFRFILLYTACLTPLSSQWISFDLEKADVTAFKKQVEPTIVSSALTGGRSTMLSLSQNQRFGIAVSIPLGWTFVSSYQSNPLLQPFIIEGQFLLTENLVLNGKMNMFSIGETSVHAAGYGCNYFGETGFTSVSLGWLEGPQHLRIRYADIAFIMKKYISEIPLFLGVGFDDYKGSILKIDDENIPKSITGSMTYLITGTTFQVYGTDIEFQTQLHSKFLQLNVTFSRLFF
ncbi:MAG TPA: hypothetical protein QGF08_06630 [Candidatus Marinimicrobia bacterium]|jgi:hypothetical protein|nr:hypothetical protein [Candidatus Neomarinimicrobiota bacterium]MDP6275714.1 hypothetical protein [Candidatus Neomarinimicrobiota bacterium]MDP7331085.1 hypothetical protein [Candidatus Neomarinimicrobiota bacterium]HJL75519.1 hypothetical protein [Candidatus Neomarinimicrobiota bacterium]HJM70540.1 hypothetical protein [Candidatus Neomarinimicrobiota bacterium]|tara:strand:+ start:4430 stop:5125 length:696 start_codon:yes stop_codon:yes gene_type:complete